MLRGARRHLISVTALAEQRLAATTSLLAPQCLASAPVQHWLRPSAPHWQPAACFSTALDQFRVSGGSRGSPTGGRGGARWLPPPQLPSSKPRHQATVTASQPASAALRIRLPLPPKCHGKQCLPTPPLATPPLLTHAHISLPHTPPHTHTLAHHHIHATTPHTSTQYVGVVCVVVTWRVLYGCV